MREGRETEVETRNHPDQTSDHDNDDCDDDDNDNDDDDGGGGGGCGDDDVDLHGEEVLGGRLPLLLPLLCCLPPEKIKNTQWRKAKLNAIAPLRS